MASGEIDVVLFDLGGVLIELRGVEPMRKLSGIASDDELWHRWLSSPWVREFERGGCSPTEFAAGLVSEWGLSVDPAAFLEVFAAWPIGPLPGADELVDTTRQAVTVGCLSNTNALHWEENFRHWPILHAFEHRFLSFELGLLKPDRDLFDRVAELLPVPRERVLFLDDNLINVDGALEAGFAAVHVRGVDEARAVLATAGVLNP